MDNKNSAHEMRSFDKLTFKIADFEGPLDLLLHLIKKNEMDIYDIPMTEITSQYIDYLHHMKKMELDIAGEYFVTAAMLLNIKSRMLLPSHPYEDEGLADNSDDLQEDPRDTLVQQLLTHQLYQQAAGQLREKYEERTQHYERDTALVPADAHLGRLDAQSANIKQLARAFSKVLLRQEKSMPIRRSVSNDKYSIKEEMVRLDQKVRTAHRPVFFNELFHSEFEIELYVTTFLALLELVKKGKIKMVQNSNFEQIKMVSGG